MTLATYSDLQSAVADWLARPDDPTLAPFIPDFVTLAEARLNRQLRLRGMEARATATLAGAYTALPEDFLEMRNIQLNTMPVTALSYVTPQQLDATFAGTTVGRPTVYTIVGDSIQFGPAPDGSYEAEIAYYRKIPALSASEPTNWLLNAAPDLYLYAVLLEATSFLMNDERLPVWAAAYDNAVQALTAADDRGRWGGSALQIRTDAAGL